MLAMHDDEDIKVTFTCPVIAPRAYIAKGPSGWPETFKRADADRALVELIQPVAIEELVDIFIRRRETAENKTPTNWYTIVGYLSRTMQIPVASIPHNAAIAFWGRVVMASISRTIN